MRYLSRNLRNGIILSLILAVGIFNSACFSSGDQKKLARAEDDFAQGLKSTATIIEQAKTDGMLSPEDIGVIKPILQTVAKSHLEVIKLTKEAYKLSDTVSPEKQQQIMQILSFLSDELTRLNNEGTLRIKDPTTRLLFTTTVVAIHSAATTAATILVKQNKKVVSK